MRIVHKINGKTVTADEFDRHEIPKLCRAAGSPKGLLPMSRSNVEGYSIACSIPDPTPQRIAEANQICRENGLTGVHFNPAHKHNCRVTDNRHFARFLSLTGKSNIDGGFNGY